MNYIYYDFLHVLQFSHNFFWKLIKFSNRQSLQMAELRKINFI